MPIKLPLHEKENAFEEAVFLVDLNKLAYVCFIDKIENKTDLSQILELRGEIIKKECFKFVDQMMPRADFELFTLYIVSDKNKRWRKLFPKPRIDAIGTYFHIEELKHIVNTEESDPLMLFKFSKAYTEVVAQCDIKTKDCNLSVFAAYIQNGHCLWSEGEVRPEILVFRPSLSDRYIKRSNDKRKEHKALISINGKTENVVVYKYCDYAPFFAKVNDVNKSSILLEEFPRPIWFTNDQYETQSPHLISSQLEMLAFWLLVLGKDIRLDFDFITEGMPLMMKVIIDPRIKPIMRPHDAPPEILLNQIEVPVTINKANIEVLIPIDILIWYAKPDNQGERHLILQVLKKIVKSKQGDTEQKLRQLIDERIPVNNAKMASVLANANNIMLENINLPAYRSIQQHDLAEIRINLTRSYEIQVTPEKSETTNSKISLCWEIQSVLEKKLIQQLKEYDAMELLPILLNGHEACVQKRAMQQLDLPARTALFGSDSIFILKEHSKEQDRIRTSLALRCLIELIVTYNTVEGKKLPNFDDIDKLIALMSEMIAWASLAEGIHLGLYDPKIELLACGKIQVDYESINSKMFPFGFTKTEIELHEYDSSYDNLYDLPEIDVTEPASDDVGEVEQAFLQEFGISFLRLHDFLTDLVNLARSNQICTVSIDEQILFGKMKATKFKWTDSEIKAALNALTLIQGWEIGVPPEGYRKKDTQPWHYNRALSFLRRPIAKLISEGRIYYLWSYRHLYAAFDSTYMLLVSGTYWSPGNGPISKLSSKYANRKGDFFRENVHSWLKENSDLEVIEKEVPIKPSRDLNLGDIDILAIDHSKKTIYSIECKNTSESKSVFDFKTDVDHYLNPEGKKYVEKHQKRDAWIKENPECLTAQVKNPETYKLISLLITAFEIPLSYTHQPPLPILSFPRIKLEGIQSLKNLASE